jgi:hypothetical protein
MRNMDQQHPPHRKSGGGDEHAGVSDRKLMVVILVIIGLAVGGWFVIQQLIATTRVQDCITRGGRNCTSIPDPGSSP